MHAFCVDRTIGQLFVKHERVNLCDDAKSSLKLTHAELHHVNDADKMTSSGGLLNLGERPRIESPH
jgi:hypothetical protein